MALTEYVMMPGADYQAACDMLRSKTGKTDLIKSGDLATEIGDLCNGSSDRNPDSKPIRFYDPYGNVLYGYTRAEAQELTELPPGPTLSGVTFDRWTHTLEEIKNTQYFAEVGPQYKLNGNPCTVLIVDVYAANRSFTFNADLWSSDMKMTVSWGDGTSSTTLTGSSSTRKRSASHTYTTAGRKIIAVIASGTPGGLGLYQSNYYYPPIGPGINMSYVAGSVTPDYSLRSILIGTYNTSNYPVYVGTATHCVGLTFVSTYKQSSRSGSSAYKLCPALRAIAGETAHRSVSSGYFQRCANLRRVWVNGSIAAGTFAECDALQEIIFGDGTINEPNMNVNWAMLMTTETPPTIGATSPVWGDKPIYVPDSAVDAYKTAAGWSSAANCILPRSQYPD